jgi:undecaprenyl-diphosphatase
MRPPPKNIQKKVKEFSFRFLIVLGIFLLALILFILIADEFVLQKETGLDSIVFRALSGITGRSTTEVMLFITFFGSPYFLLTAYILLVGYYLIFRKNTKLSLDVAAIGIISSILLFSLKSFFHRLRPLDPIVKPVKGFSFPSGHSFSSFTFFGLLIYIIWQYRFSKLWKWILTILFFLFACLIAFSRVYLHVHYASDVVAGFFLSLTFLSFSLWILNRRNARNGRRQT